MDADTVHYRVSNFHAWVIIVLSIGIDTLVFMVALIPFVGGIIGTFLGALAFFIFIVWFMVLGVHFLDKTERLAFKITMLLTELIPYVNILPMWTIGNILIIHQSRADDRKKAREAQQAGTA